MYQVKEVSKVLQKNKMSVYVTDEMKEYLNSQAISLGISTNAFMVMIFNSYRQQNEAIEAANNVQVLLHELNSKIDKLSK